MRTNIDLDDELLARAAEIAGTKTKKSTVEHALRELIRVQAMKNLADLRGKVAMLDMEEIRPGWEPSQRPPADASAAKASGRQPAARKPRAKSA